jgi:hypothetical protein
MSVLARRISPAANKNSDRLPGRVLSGRDLYKSVSYAIKSSFAKDAFKETS